MGGGKYDPSKYEGAISMERTKIAEDVAEESFAMQERALKAKDTALDYLDEGYGLLSNFLNVQTGQLKDTNVFLGRLKDEDIPKLKEQALAGASFLNENLLTNLDRYRSFFTQKGGF